MMGAADLIFITLNHNLSFMGKTWWMLMLVLRLLVVSVAGFSLFGDEQERFVCNTIQPGCSNVCFDVFAPVSVVRLWLLHLVLLSLPHLMFVLYIMHKMLSRSYTGAFYWSRGDSTLSQENSSFSGEVSLNKAPLRDLPGTRRFHCSYFLVVILRILLEAFFGAGQFFLFGLSFPKNFLCYEAPCMSGVECYISRPTEKTLMLNLMLGIAALSVLLSLVELLSSMRAKVRWRRKKRAMLMEEMSKAEQSFTAEYADLSSKNSASGSLKNSLRDEKHSGCSNGVSVNGELLNSKGPTGPSFKTSANEKSLKCTDTKTETSHSSAPIGSLATTHYVVHSQTRPQPSPRLERPLPNSGIPIPVGVKKLGLNTVVANSGQQSDSSESHQERRAWV